MAGVKGKSGRKKSPTTAIKEALDYTIQQLPGLVLVYTDLCKDGKHAELFQYLWDRVAGKPKAAVEIEGSEKLGMGLITELFKVLSDRRRELLKEGQIEVKELKEGRYAIEQGKDEGT